MNEDAVQLPGQLLIAAVRRLYDGWQVWDLRFHIADQLKTRLLIELRILVKLHIRNEAEEEFLVFVEDLYCLLIIGGYQYLRTHPQTKHFIELVHGAYILNDAPGLFHHTVIEQRNIS